MQRLIEIGLWNRDVVFEAPGHRPPKRMDHAQHGIAVHLRIGHDPQCSQIVDLLERNRLLVHLLINAVEMFGRPIDLSSQSILLHGLLHELA